MIATPTIIVRHLGLQPYRPILDAMRTFSSERQADTADELWCLQHFPVYTQGLNGKAEHLLAPGDIAVEAVDRGGQVTYHGPGQLVIYCLLDLRRAELGARQLVSILENALIATLAGHGIAAHARPEAPGVYVDASKIASLGLRIKKRCSYHGLSLNIAMDLEPFQRINPCGYAGLKVTQLQDLTPEPLSLEAVAAQLVAHLASLLGMTPVQHPASLPPSRLMETDCHG